jgi:hypothetical protein
MNTDVNEEKSLKLYFSPQRLLPSKPLTPVINILFLFEIIYLATDQASHEASTRQASHRHTQTINSADSAELMAYALSFFKASQIILQAFAAFAGPAGLQCWADSCTK